MTDIYKIFNDYVKEQNLFDDGDNVVMGISGGADSMCLLIMMSHLSSKMQLKLTAVHVNHQLRGREADEDESFVRSFCESLGVKCVCVHADVRGYAEKKGLSVEEAGRIARYQTFLKVAKMVAKDDINIADIKVAVAHHQDDNAETVILNLLRGTGLKGMQGMLPKAERFGMTVVRPLLCLGRTEIESFLTANSVQFRTDSTNLVDEYARNKVRMNILPQMKEVNQKAAAHINEAAQILVQVQDFVDRESDKVYHMVTDVRPEGLHIDLDRFRYVEPVVQSAVIQKAIGVMAGSLKDIGRVHIASVLGLLEKQTGRKAELPYGLVAVRSYGNIIIRKMTEEDIIAWQMSENINSQKEESPKEDYFSISLSELSGEPEVYELWNGMELTLQLVEVNAATIPELIAKNKYTKAFDCAKIKGNLVLRKPEPGDEIQFSGGTKTVKKFFVDQKVPQDERRRAFVLKDENSVLWIIGHRISEAYKITGSTAVALQVGISGGNYE